MSAPIPRQARSVVQRVLAAGLLTVAMSEWCAGVARPQSARTDFYVTNGTVFAEALSGSTLFVGGSFSRVGPPTGSGVPLAAASGAPLDGFPRVLGQVNVVASDGAGGWFIAGAFTSVGGVARSNLAHVLADQSVSGWDPGANNAVRALVVSGGTVYVGGDFTIVGGQSRASIAALDSATGLATAWDPSANGSVQSLARSGETVYAGGQFTTIGGQTRRRIAALDATTGLASGWDPGADGTVRALALDGGTIYAGGFFSSIGGQTRNNLAALDSTTGQSTAWNPGSNGQVAALAMDGATLYAGGSFTTIGRQPRNRIAALDRASGQPTGWNPNASAQVLVVVASDGVVYAGGDFQVIGGQLRSQLAAVDTATGQATAWDPSAYGTVTALAASDGVVYAGGSFAGMGGLLRNNLAAFDVSSGAVTSWDPNADGQVSALAAGPNAVYAGGLFASVGGQPRSYLAALGPASGLATTWNPNADGQILALHVSNGAVYAGGLFGSLGGQPRSSLAAVDAASGLATSWNPNVDGLVYVLDVIGGTLYAGGSFSEVGGQARNNLAAVDLATGTPTSWNPNPNGTVRSLELGCGTVYAGGFFTTIGGQARTSLAALDATSGLASTWNPTANGPVFALLLDDGKVYVGGVFNLVGGQSRNRIAALDPGSGQATAWNPNSNGTIRALVAASGSVYAGGAFGAIGGARVANLAAISADPSLTCPLVVLAPPTLPAGVKDVAYAQTLAASGGGAPYCYAVTGGRLPDGLALDPATGRIEGVPTVAGAFPFSVGVTDARNCTGSATYVLSIFHSPAQSFVVANTNGLCISSAHPCVSVPFEYQRSDSVPARAMSVTFQIDVTKCSLCTPGTPAQSIHAGSWLADFDRSFQVVDLGGGAYKVDQTILGFPCGTTGGGQVFSVDVKSVDGDGGGAITVTAVSVRDCNNDAIAAVPGPADTLAILNTPIAILPDTLPSATTGVPYSQVLTAGAGVGPFSFALTAGSLPPGLALSTSGVLSGTPMAPDVSPFTVAVSDSRGCPGSRAYSLAVTCAPIALRPTALPGGVVGIPYGQTLAALAGRPPYAFALLSGALPHGLTLASDGTLSGSPDSSASCVILVGVTDANGCTGSRSYLVNIFATLPESFVTANTSGLCVTPTNPCVTVPFVFVRADTLPARAMSVLFQLDESKLTLCTPTNPAASIHPGPWLAGFDRSFHVVDNGGGSYTVDQVILGTTCGATGGGPIFTVDLKAIGDDGDGTITVAAVGVRDCDNAPIPAAAGAPAELTIDNLGPAAITDLASTPGTPASDSSGTIDVRLTWSTGGVGSVSLYRAPFGSYPEYDDDMQVVPPTPQTAPGPPWSLVVTDATPGYLDHGASRGYWHYVAIVTDPCGVRSIVSNMPAGVLNYYLGDVCDGRTQGQGDNRVSTEDVSLLGANYGIGDAEITARHVEFLDFGPTTDGLPRSRPTPDDQIDIEDLMILATSYPGSTGPEPGIRRASARSDRAQPASARDEFFVTAPSQVEEGQIVSADLWLRGSGRMQGFSVRVGWDPAVVQPIGMHSSQLIEAQGGVVLSPRAGTVDAALLGVREQGMTGDSVVATVAFQALKAGLPGFHVASVVARDSANGPLDAGAVLSAARPVPPAATLLLAPLPNPFRGEVTLTFGLARSGPIVLEVYSVDGRKVRTLASGQREAGIYHIGWNGTDDARRSISPGVYYARLTAAGHTFTKRLVYLR